MLGVDFQYRCEILPTRISRFAAVGSTIGILSFLQLYYYRRKGTMTRVTITPVLNRGP